VRVCSYPQIGESGYMPVGYLPQPDESMGEVYAKQFKAQVADSCASRRDCWCLCLLFASAFVPDLPSMIWPMHLHIGTRKGYIRESGFRRTGKHWHWQSGAGFDETGTSSAGPLYKLLCVIPLLKAT